MNMKVTTESAKALIPKLMKIGKGKTLDFGSVFPGIADEQTQAICTECDPIRYFWQFSLYWMSIHVGDVVAEINGPDLILEVL